MKSYLNKTDVIIDLHKQGFTDDFQLVGNDLLWIQENIFIRVGEFAIAEYHKIEESMVFAIVALHYNIKGILLSRIKTNSNATAPVLIKKLNELNAVV